MSKPNEPELPDNYGRIFNKIAQDEDLRLPEHEDDDFSEPDQVQEFKDDRRKSTYLTPNRLRSIVRLARNPVALNKLEQDVNKKTSNLSVKCYHKDCGKEATHFIHEQTSSKSDKYRDTNKKHKIADPSKLDSGAFEVGFSCPEHANKLISLRMPRLGIIGAIGRLAADIAGKRSPEYYENYEKQEMRESNPEDLHTTATPISRYIHTKDAPDAPKHSPILYGDEHEDENSLENLLQPNLGSRTQTDETHDPRTLTPQSSLILHDAYQNKLSEQMPEGLLEDRNKLLNAKRYLTFKKNRILSSQRILRGSKYSVRDLLTNESDQPASPSGKYADIAKFGAPVMREVFGDPSNPEKSIGPGRRSKSDISGHVYVAGLGGSSEQQEKRNKILAGIDLARLEPEPGDYDESGAYVESPYDVYSKSFPTISKYSKKTMAKLLRPIFKSPKWRKTSWAATEHIRATDPKATTQLTRDIDASKIAAKTYQGGRPVSGPVDETGGGVNEKEVAPSPPLLAAHEIQGNAENDWDVRHYNGAPVLVNKNNRVVYAHFEPHIDENGEASSSKGYWLATAQRVRHATEPRYVSSEEVSSKVLTRDEMVQAASQSKFDKTDHSDCLQQYIDTDGKKGHLDNNLDNSECPKKIDYGELYKSIIGKPGADRIAHVTALADRSGQSGVETLMGHFPPRFGQSLRTSTFSHQPCHNKFLLSEGKKGHDNTEEENDNCTALTKIRERYQSPVQRPESGE